MTSISDLARVIPMLVPSPPFSFSTTAWSSTALTASGSSSASGSVVSGSISDSRIMPCSPCSSELLVVGERLDRDLGQPLRAHLSVAAPTGRDPRRFRVGA